MKVHSSALEPPEKFLLWKPTLAELDLPQDCTHFHKSFCGESKGWWLFLLENWEIFFMTLTSFKMSFMGNLAFVLIQNAACSDISRGLLPPRKCVAFWFKSFFLRQLAVILENMTNFRTLIYIHRSHILDTIQMQDMK